MQSAFPWKRDIPQLIIILFILLLTMVPADTDVLYVPDEALIPNALVVYTYYTDKLPWNKAQEACRQAHGGTLVTIDSYEVWWRIHELVDNDWDSDWDHSWTGLHWRSSTSKSWIDSTCQPYEDHGAPYKDSSQADHESGKECYILEAGTVAFERKECKDEFGFICQHYESDPSPGYEHVSIDLQTVDVSGTNCQAKCDQVLGCFLNSQLSTDICILGVLDEAAVTFGKVYAYRGETASLSSSIENAVNSLVSNINNPEVCDENNFIQPSFAGTFSAVDDVDSGLNSDCSQNETTHTVTSISTSTRTENVTISCAELTTTITTTNYAVSTVELTTTKTETSSNIVNCATEQNVIVSTTNVITTTPLYVTSTIVTSLPCHAISSTVCPSCYCYSSEDLSTSISNIADTSTSAASTTSTPNILSTPASIALIDSSLNELTPSVSSMNVQELHHQLTEGTAQGLRVDPKTTAKALARLNSASDTRPSAVAMGLVAVTILTVSVGTIILMDIPAFAIVCKSHMKSLRKMARSSHC